MFDTILSGNYDPRSFDNKTGNQLKAFAMQASGAFGDTTQDRWSSIFTGLRVPLTENNWYASRDLRAFLSDTVDSNPFIPQVMRELNAQARPGAHTVNSYAESWRRENPDYPIDPFKINLDDFIKTIHSSPGVAQRFAKSNLHNSDYYFLKFTEWYISSWMCRLYGYRNILDIGSHSRIFGELITGMLPRSHVTLLDLSYRPGMKNVSDRMMEVGADAGHMDAVQSNSMDYVCLHNAFEHFCGDSDIRCMREIERILRPGGRAVVIPFMMAPLYTIMINPVSCFFARRDDYFERIAQDEAGRNGAHVRLVTGFVSPFARLYNAQQARRRVLAAAGGMEARLCCIGFEEAVPIQGVHAELLYGQELRYDLFERKPYFFLEFVKRHPPAQFPQR